MGFKLNSCPSKSSLSEFRNNLSFEFFKDIYETHLSSLERETFKGHYVYAIDGDQLNLPVSSDIIANGYRGYPTSKNRETHYPKMYTVHAYDVLNNIVRDFRYDSIQSETSSAQSMVLGFEKNSISIYDRLHCGYLTFLSHESAGNYFIARARTGGSGSNKEVMEFLNSNKKDKEFEWKPTWVYRGFMSLKLRMIKVKNPRTKEFAVFITNLNSKDFSYDEIAALYRHRWDIETSFRDITHTLKLNQLHSKTTNGILQEVYALLWFVNNIKYRLSKVIPTHLLSKSYKKANFKLCCEIFIENLYLLITRKNRRLEEIMDYWINRSLEKREHLRRSYPRAVRSRGKGYLEMNVVPRR